MYVFEDINRHYSKSLQNLDKYSSKSGENTEYYLSKEQNLTDVLNRLYMIMGIFSCWVL